MLKQLLHKIIRYPKNKLAVIALLSTIIAETILILSPITISDKNLQTLSDQAVAACRDKKGNSSACYENTIPQLMDRISMADAFKVTEIVMTKDTSFQYCHAVAHKLSEREVKKDPRNWQSIIPKCPEGVCANGCLHGVFQQHFRSESLSEAQITEIIPILKTVCENVPGWKPTENERFSCYHALGHVSVYLTNANIKKSVDICNQIASDANGVSRLQTCFEGIYMQIFTHIEPDDAALVQGLGVNIHTFSTFCGSFSGMAMEACYRESWILQREKLMTAPGMVEFCNLVPGDRAVQACYNKMFFTITSALNFDAQKMAVICLGLSKDWQPKCFGDAAVSPLTAEHKFVSSAVAMCQRAASVGDDEYCYQEIADLATSIYLRDSMDLIKLCQALPSKMRSRCLGN